MQATKKKIYVRNHDHGFWTEEPVTVKRKEDGNIIYCDHAGAVEEEQENVMYRPDGRDIVWTSRALICGCGAYQLENDNYWQDAPVGGKHE